jgi:hypothetical protein
METASARYCYAVFMRHLVRIHSVTGRDPLGRIAELGPGGSLGTGLAAMIAGARRYFAFDVQRHSDRDSNIRVFDELVELFRQRAAIPNSDEFPEVKPAIADYAFPHHILDEMRMNLALEESRLKRLRREVAEDSPTDESLVRYVAPWHAPSIVQYGAIDWIFSQAVLEHVVDLPFVYRAFHAWLATDGLMSHQIDFRSHGTAPSWDGYRSYGDLTWRLICGARPYLINREPLSRHRGIARKAGFDQLAADIITMRPHLTRAQLARRFRTLSDEDLSASGAFLIYRKRSDK